MPLIFELNSNYFVKENFQLRKSPEVAQLLKYDLEEQTYPSLPPFLFPDQVFNITKVFRTEQLAKVRVLALGLTLARILSILHARHWVPSSVAKAGSRAIAAAHPR